MNCGCDRLAMARVSSAASGTVTSAINASSGEMTNIITSTPTTVSTEIMSWLMVCCRVCATLSMSLVTRDRISPRDLESKYDRGSRESLSSTSSRSLATVRWTTTVVSRPWISREDGSTRHRQPSADIRTQPSAVVVDARSRIEVERTDEIGLAVVALRLQARDDLGLACSRGEALVDEASEDDVRRVSEDRRAQHTQRHAGDTHHHDEDRHQPLSRAGSRSGGVPSP